MTFFNADILALLTSSRTEERRGHLLLKEVWLLHNESGSKSTSEALADHLTNLAMSPYHLSPSAEQLTKLEPFTFLSPPQCSSIQQEEQHYPLTIGGLDQNLLVSIAFQEKSAHSPVRTDCRYRKAWIAFELQVEFLYDKPKADSLFHGTKYMELAISL